MESIIESKMLSAKCTREKATKMLMIELEIIAKELDGPVIISGIEDSCTLYMMNVEHITYEMGKLLHALSQSAFERAGYKVDYIGLLKSVEDRLLIFRCHTQDPQHTPVMELFPEVVESVLQSLRTSS